MKNFKFISLFLVLVISVTGCKEESSVADAVKKDLVKKQIVGEEISQLSYAPNVPPPITRDHPTKVIVNLETKEVTQRLADGVDYTFWTFGGRVPGKFIRVRQNDLVEFNLSNHPDSKMPHNIDLHAVTGPGGGATSSLTAPGHTSKFSFTAAIPGLFVYHCATAPVGMHIANGMYGLILVEPEGGLPKVDKEYYIMQSEFYTKGAYGDAGHQSFSMKKALAENPDYVVFNGSVGALTGDNAITAEKGETVRLFVGNGGPNLVSSFHVIGEIFDKAFTEGGLIANHNVQTTMVPAGGSTMVEFGVDVPGTFILVDHSIFRAFNKGALGMMSVSGTEDLAMYSGKQSDALYQPEGMMVAKAAVVEAVATNPAERVHLGEKIYQNNCTGCHQSDGQGLEGAFPPLAKSDYLQNKLNSIAAVKNGLSGTVKVNNHNYNGAMPNLGLSDESIANVLTYIYDSWGNSKLVVTPAEVSNVEPGGSSEIAGH
ncbi:MAG: copper-containing nitrite reductase [Bermanella sp.]